MVEKPTNLDSQLPKAKSEKSPLGDISETKARGELLRDALEQPGTDFDRSRARRTMEVAFRDEPKKSEDGKPQQAKDEAKPADVKADTSISAQEQTKRDAAVKEANDGIERGNLLRTDSIAGSWSPRSQETWKKLFDDISKQPGMTADEAVIALNEAGVAINSQLEKAKSPYTVGMAVQKGADGKTTFTMQLNSDQTKEANRVALAEGKDIPTSLRVGSMDTVSKPDATKDSKKDQGGLAGTDYPRNAAGAYVKMGAYNKPELIVHKDGTKIVPQWESHKDGKPAVLRSYDETSADGKQTRTWNREGDNFTALGADGKKLVVKNVEFDKSNNGNMSFSDVNGRSFVMRGTGAVIPTGQDFPRFEFDKQGRIASIIPTTAEWNKGAPSLGFSYENDKTDKIYQIGTLTKSEQAKGSQGTRRALKPGEMLADNGDIRTPEVVSFNSKNFSGTRVHRPGTAFAADDRQVPFVEDNKLASIAHFNTQNTFVGVEGFSKDGQLLKTYTRENITVKGADGKVALRNQIIEIDHIAGNTTKWTTQADNKFHGTRTIEGGKPVNIDQGIRQNIGFNNLAVLDYTDDKGEWTPSLKMAEKK